MEDRKKKILYLSPNGYIGGAEKFVLDICKAHLGKSNYYPIILFFSGGQAVVRAQDMGIESIVLPFKTRIANPLAFLRAILFIRKIIHRHHIDIVHTTMPYGQIFGSLASMFMHIPLVWFQHGPVGGMLDILAAKLAVSKIFFNSEFLLAEHESSVSTIKAQTAIIPLGVKAESVEVDLGRDYLDYSDQLLVGMVGRITEWKGYHNFIDAIGKLKKENEPIFQRAKYIIVGDAKTDRDKIYEQALRKSVVEQGLADNVFFLGYRPDVANVFSSIDVFVHASTIAEPFGYVVAEAMLYDTVVIGSDVGGVKDILRDQETGVVFSSNEPDAFVFLAEKLREVITNFEKFYIVRENARRFIESRYSVDNMIDVVEKEYDLLFE